MFDSGKLARFENSQNVKITVVIKLWAGRLWQDPERRIITSSIFVSLNTVANSSGGSLREEFPHGHLNVFFLDYLGGVENLNLQGLPFGRQVDNDSFGYISGIRGFAFPQFDNQDICVT